MNQNGPTVHVKLALKEDSARFEYEIRNSLDQPIYVFDRLYDLRAQKLSPDWAYVSVDGQKANVCRQIWPLPDGLLHDNPETPYGRLVAPNAIVTGQFSLALPLVEGDPYYSLLHSKGKLTQVNVRSLVFRIGWGAALQLRAGSEVELEGEKLVLFPFHEALSKQHFAETSATQVNLSVTAYR